MCRLSCGNPKTVYITIDGNGFFPPILRRDVGTIGNPVMMQGTASAPMMATTTAIATVTETITSQVTVVASITQVVTVTEKFECSPIIKPKVKAVATETAEAIPEDVYYYVAVSNSTQYLDKTPPPGIPLQSSTTTVKVQPVPTGAVTVITELVTEPEGDEETSTGFVTVTSTSTRLHTVTVANDSMGVSSEEALRTPIFNVRLGPEGWNQTSISATAGPTVAMLAVNSSAPMGDNTNSTTTVFIETVPGPTTTITQKLLFANQTRTALEANPTLSFITTLDAKESAAINNNASMTSTSAGTNNGVNGTHGGLSKRTVAQPTMLMTIH